MHTGSGRVGRIVATAAAKHLTPCTLEVNLGSQGWPRDSVLIILSCILSAARRSADLVHTLKKLLIFCTTIQAKAP